MKVRPDKKQLEHSVLQRLSISNELSTGWTEGQQSDIAQEIEQLYVRECEAFAQGLVNDIHVLLSSIPPDHVDMHGDGAGNPVGLAIVHNIVAKMEHLSSEPPALDPEVTT